MRSRRDVVLIAGKGHEDYQIDGSERRAFSDQKVVAAALAARAGGARMSRTLADFAQSCGGTLRGRRSRLHRRVHRHAHARRPASCSSRCAGRASTATISSRPRRPRGAAGAVVDTPRRSAAAADRRAPTRQAALTQLRGRLARAVLDARGRRHRQQRQDHGQGDDRGDPRSARARRSRRAATSTTTSACR